MLVITPTCAKLGKICKKWYDLISENYLVYIIVTVTLLITAITIIVIKFL